MIFVMELPDDAPARVWFAFDALDLLRKVVAVDPDRVRALQARIDADDPRELADAALRERGCRVWWTESEAMAAFERSADPLWQGAGWRARWALREQLVALEVLADDL